MPVRSSSIHQSPKLSTYWLCQTSAADRFLGLVTSYAFAFSKSFKTLTHPSPRLSTYWRCQTSAAVSFWGFGNIVRFCLQQKRLERVAGIEPAYSAWKAAALPLCYTRIGYDACHNHKTHTRLAVVLLSVSGKGLVEEAGFEPAYA